MSVFLRHRRVGELGLDKTELTFIIPHHKECSTPESEYFMENTQAQETEFSMSVSKLLTGVLPTPDIN